MAQVKKGRAEAVRDIAAGTTGTNPEGLTFEQFLLKVGYKPLNFPDFDSWLKSIFDANNNGKIDKGSEKRKYNKAVKNSGTVNEYLAEYQHAQAAAMAADNVTVDNLRLLWQQGNSRAAKEAASRDAMTKERNNMGGGEEKKNNIIVLALAAIAGLFLLKK